MPAVSTATIAELKAEGFEAAQFGVDEGSNAGQWDVYLQDLLDEQALIVKQRMGDSAYATSATALKNRIKRTERFMAAAELWLRRMNQVESDVSLGGEDNKNAGYQRYEYNYKTYAKKANVELAGLPSVKAAPTEATSAPVFGHVSSGAAIS